MFTLSHGLANIIKSPVRFSTHKDVMSISIPLNGTQKNKLIALVENPPIAPNFALTGKINPNLRVFVANFDGTQNDKDNIPKGEQATLIAKSYEKYCYSTDKGVVSRYYRGVGTTKLPLTRMIQSATGLGCISNAEAAHAEFVAQVAIWREENPHVEIHVHATGFSRGAATAMHFLNLVHERGGALEGKAFMVPPQLRPKAIQSSTVLLDTVSTGQGDRLNLTLPDSCVAALHLVAEDEQRSLFPVREIAAAMDQEISIGVGATMHGHQPDLMGQIHYTRVQELTLPGVHSDVGGSYIGGGIMKVSEFLMDRFQQSLGLDVTPIRPTVEDIQHCAMHDSRFDIDKIIGGRVPKMNNQRISQKLQNDNWTGAWALDSTIYGIERAEEAFNDFSVHKAYIDDKSDDILTNYLSGESKLSGEPFKNYAKAMMGKLIQISLIPEPSTSGMSDDAFVLSQGIAVIVDLPNKQLPPSGAVQMKEDGLYILGEKIKGVPSAKELRHQWQLQNNAGLTPRPVTINTKAWRVGSWARSHQDPTFSYQPLPNVSSDPWPSPITQMIKYLNKTPQIDAQKAKKVLNLAAQSCADAIAIDMREAASVTITPVKQHLQTTTGTINTNRYTITVTHLNGTVITSEEMPQKISDRETYIRLRQLARGLSEIGQGLIGLGFTPQNDQILAFSRDGAPSTHSDHIDLSRMRPADPFALPAMVDKTNTDLSPIDLSQKDQLRRRLKIKRGDAIMTELLNNIVKPSSLKM